ncbi:ANK_REP_REGION domain-containing protein [Haematococcus lacustris]|uniref:ANK_REP_REGION domain-containing protein n=2 Tax=Haematococcus lacustris TaxID=44745 RepID=A0A699Z9F3_HAELA|nr:ANK_REP_REGION domain-containing protein [Haematococcus lacustris]
MNPAMAEAMKRAMSDPKATDSLGNTPLHYAAGYGRDMLVMLLLDAGADKSARNANKKAAVDLATADPRNPVSQKPDIVSRLKL